MRAVPVPELLVRRGQRRGGRVGREAGRTWTCGRLRGAKDGKVIVPGPARSCNGSGNLFVGRRVVRAEYLAETGFLPRPPEPAKPADWATWGGIGALPRPGRMACIAPRETAIVQGGHSDCRANSRRPEPAMLSRRSFLVSGLGAPWPRPSVLLAQSRTGYNERRSSPSSRPTTRKTSGRSTSDSKDPRIVVEKCRAAGPRSSGT